MSPALTQMLVDLGHSNHIVGLHSYDPLAGKLAPTVGDLYQMDYEKLLSLKPTQLFLQPGKPGVPAKLTEMAQRHGWKLHVHDIELRDDALDALMGIAREIGQEAAAATMRSGIERRWKAVERIACGGGEPGVKTLLVIGRNPMTCAGPNTFLSQMLMAAGGVNVLGESANRYPVIDKEAALRLDPAVILIVQAAEWEEGQELALPPSLAGRMRRLVDSQALLPTTTMPRVVAAMAKVLHPQLSQRIDAAMSGEDKP